MNPAGADGVFFGGGWGLFGEQVLAVAVVFVLVRRLRPHRARAEGGVAGGIRVSEEDEQVGLDLTQHSETGYALERI